METLSALPDFCEEIHWSPVDSPLKGPAIQIVDDFFLLARTNRWTNNWDPGDLRRHDPHVTPLQYMTFLPGKYAYNVIVVFRFSVVILLRMIYMGMDMDNIDSYLTATIHDKAWTICIILWMYYVTMQVYCIKWWRYSDSLQLCSFMWIVDFNVVCRWRNCQCKSKSWSVPLSIVAAYIKNRS